MPRASTSLRLLAFTVPAGLAVGGAQPLLGAAAGAVGYVWSVGLSAPTLAAAAGGFALGRLFARDDRTQPPSYSAWVLLPGAFVLAGAAAMCIFGAFVELDAIRWAVWLLLAAGMLLWSAALGVVRLASR